MRHRLSAAQVADLAELLEEAPRRAGVVDEVLQAADEGRGMTLFLADAACPPRKSVKARAARRRADPNCESGKRQ